MVIDWHHFPVITGLMLTSIPERREHALAAIEDFMAQEWPHKSLVVVNSTGRPFPVPKCDYVKQIIAGSPDREAGFAQCQGEWIADWPDDCRYSRHYLRFLARLRDKQKKVSLAGYSGICVDTNAQVNVDNDGSEFTLIFRLAFNPSAATVWLDRRDLVTRYYASQGEPITV